MINIENVRTDAFEMRYFRFGTGDRTMVILPGLSVKSVMESADAIAAGYGMFGNDYTVYVFDRRTDLPDRYNVYDMAHDTEAAFDELGIRGAFVFGTSQGGMIAQVIAAERPELVGKAVLGSTAARLSENTEKLIREWSRLAANGDAEGLVNSFAETVYSEEYRRKYEGAFRVLPRLISADELQRFAILSGGTGDFDLYDELDRIKCPVLVLGAGKDRVLGAEGSEVIAAKVKNSELYIYPEGSHAAYDEESDYKERIQEFFGKQ
ncbi:MAG: alpha/beta hydrolase [Ruminiclostridium sp.]|nr:alpha/beta hydrolase [Ruminiclostridium sp.]